MNPYEMIVASVDVQGAFPHARHRLLTEVWDTMGLPFLFFMTVTSRPGSTPSSQPQALPPGPAHQRGPLGWRRGPLSVPPSHPPTGI